MDTVGSDWDATFESAESANWRGGGRRFRSMNIHTDKLIYISFSPPTRPVTTLDGLPPLTFLGFPCETRRL